jgi:hypothetical protein
VWGSCVPGRRASAFRCSGRGYRDPGREDDKKRRDARARLQHDTGSGFARPRSQRFGRRAGSLVLVQARVSSMTTCSESPA